MSLTLLNDHKRRTKFLIYQKQQLAQDAFCNLCVLEACGFLVSVHKICVESDRRIIHRKRISAGYYGLQAIVFLRRLYSSQ